MKLDHSFAKLKTDRTLDFGPVPLKVVTRRREEEDVPKYDPETGEPTGEVEHVVRDRDVTEIKVRPTAADFRQMGYLPVVDEPPSEPAPEGYHYEAIGWFERNDGRIVRNYATRKDPPAPPKVYSTSDAIYALMERNVYDQCRQWMEAQGLRDLVLSTKEFTSDMENFDTIVGGLKQLLGWTDAQVAEVLAEAEVT